MQIQIKKKEIYARQFYNQLLFVYFLVLIIVPLMLMYLSKNLILLTLS